MSFRDAEDRTGQEDFDSQTQKIRYLSYNDKMHHELSLKHYTITLYFAVFLVEKEGFFREEAKRAFTIYILLYERSNILFV